MARLILLALGAALVSANQVTPVQKVVDMLANMKAKGQMSMQAEKKTFTAYAKWVREETTTLNYEIEKGKNTISKLTAFIDKAESDIAGLKKAISELDDDIAKMEEEKKAATTMREDEHAEYVKVSTDYQESVDAIEMALQALKSQDYDRPQAMLQLEKMAVEKPKMRRVLAALLETDETKATGHGAPAVAAYEFQSSGIVEILENLQTKFKKQLDETEAAESNAAHAYDMKVLHLDNLLADSKSDREEKAGIKAKLAGESAAAKEDLVDTKADLAEDQKTLKDTKATFAAKKDQFEANQAVRLEELEALGKAIEIMSSPDVAGSYSKHVSLVQFPAQTAMGFLQVRSHAASERSLARGRVAEFLRERAKALSSDVLAAAAADAAKNPFGKVIKMIEDLLDRLKEEAASEAEHKAWCDKELKKNKIKRDKKTSQISTLTAEVEELKSSIQTMAATIAELSKEQAQLTKAMAEATDLRQKEKAENEEAIKDAQAASEAVGKALAILRDFYSSQAFVQTAQVPEMEAYKGMQRGKGGVIGMLEVIASDFTRLETETKSEENEAAKTYSSFMAESEASKKQKHDHEFKLSLKKDQTEFEMSQTEKALKGTQEELDKANSYYDYLKPNCVEVHVSFEEREARRQEEIAALQEAYKVLDQKAR